MKNAIDALLNDHKMIRKLLSGLTPENSRYTEVLKTLERVVLSHAWFEDNVFLPAFKAEPLLLKKYLNELYEEHKDIEFSMDLVRKTGPKPSKELDAYTKQFRAILDNHLQKEEDALFPLAQQTLTKEGLEKISHEMERRQSETQKLFNPPR